ncbi:exodeoxyribonuclease V subunit gamma [Entomospira nematocerorum]|uniref:Exodeoxyribonuclease V subunit gamma n=1 Tax=Entomospira nematocerorum TaxID=2719987 RepID=A0A968GCV5_9SPIO|nr:exodeoxyribonuclease V subunit gamma [Entomospira nematocera]NIZ47459.1 exodeoxyribonuclease V subunit gamma [Entomospira nematocera]WDI34002.1 exodeoxyribonuclease V subunit gamma [Entomospira nematocera]
MACHILFINQLSQIFTSSFKEVFDPHHIWFSRSLFVEDLLVITQNKQIKEWLVRTSAKTFGIAPFTINQCQLSDQAIRQLLQNIEGIEDLFQFTRHDVSGKRQVLFVDDLRLIIYKYLEERILENDPDFQSIIDYVVVHHISGHKGSHLRDTRLFALAATLTTLLEEYSSRYQDLISSWRAGKLYKQHDHNEHWQYRMWFDLLGGPDAPFTLASDVIRYVLENKLPYKGDLRKIIIVGTPFLNNLHHQFFTHLSNYVDLYILAYSSVNIFDKSYEESIFDRQYAGALLEYKDFLDAEKLFYHVWLEPRKGESTLSQIQQGITFHDMTNTIDIDNQKSIQIFGCAEPMREVEIAKDQILAILQNNAGVMLEDICIVMSDPVVYSPYLQFLFTSAHQEIRIPLQFDEILASAHLPLSYQLITEILSLVGTRFKRSQIFDLLRNPLILERIELDDSEKEVWLHFCDEHQVAWGFNAQQREEEIQFYSEEVASDASDVFTWLKAFTSYLQVYIYMEESSVEERSFSFEEAQCIGKLIHFIHTLYYTLYHMTHSQYTLEEWIGELEPALAQFLPDTDARNGNIKLFRSLSEIATTVGNLSYFKDGGKLPFSVIIELLKEAMNRELERNIYDRSGQSGGILCAPVSALRVVPYRYMIFLGMSENNYPSREQDMTSGYSLSEYFEKAFIMKRSNNERASFLETVLLAQERVLIFYQASDRRTGERIELSSVVVDLFHQAKLEVENPQGFGLGSEELSVMYPLHSFHASLFQGESGSHYSYHRLSLLYAQAYYDCVQQKNIVNLDFSSYKPEYSSIDIKALAKFIMNPLTASLQYHLGRNDFDDVREVADDEIYVLQKKTAKKLLQRVMKQAIGQQSTVKTPSILDHVWSDAITRGDVVESSYSLEGHYEYYQQFGSALIASLEKEQWTTELGEQTSKRWSFTVDLSSFDDIPNNSVELYGTFGSLYCNTQKKSCYHHAIVDYHKITEQKTTKVSLGYQMEQVISWYLLNSLLALDECGERLHGSVAQFLEKEWKDVECTIYRYIPDTFLSREDICLLLKYYYHNIEHPLWMTTSMWLDLQEKGSTDGTITKSYYKIRNKEDIKDKIVKGIEPQLQLLGIDIETFLANELKEEEETMMEFLWDKFISIF